MLQRSDLVPAADLDHNDTIDSISDGPTVEEELTRV
jgi:hypothetical protein